MFFMWFLENGADDEAEGSGNRRRGSDGSDVPTEDVEELTENADEEEATGSGGGGISKDFIKEFLAFAIQPIAVSTFYSMFGMAFTVMTESMGIGTDFFTSGMQNFVTLIAGWGGPMIYMQITSQFGVSGLPAYAVLVYVYCALVGYWSFMLSIVLLTIISVILFAVMSVTIRFVKASWEDKDPLTGGDASSGAVARASGWYFWANEMFGAVSGFINFVMQVSLLALSAGGLSGVTAQVQENFNNMFSFSVHFPSMPTFVSAPLDAVSEFSGVIANYTEGGGDFLRDYSNLWTSRRSMANVCNGVFEIMVVFAVFVVVLSDVLLIVAAREDMGQVATRVVELASRAFLYALQAMVAVSQALISALLLINPIERAELPEAEATMEQFNSLFYLPTTYGYLAITLYVAGSLLWKLWSGDDGGLQNLAPRLMQFHGIKVKDVKAGTPSRMAFGRAFLGYWDERVLNALEVDQRCEIYKLDRETVMLATVNALSFPLYVLPYGAYVAKLGEYLNQAPIHVFSAESPDVGVNVSLKDPAFVLSASYVAEYLLVLLTSAQLLDSHEQGTAERGDTTEGLGGWWLAFISVCWLGLTLVRAWANGTNFSELRDELKDHAVELTGVGGDA